MNCRGCGAQLRHEFIDLGQAPPSNSFLTQQQLGGIEMKYPLKLFVCAECFLVQLEEYKKSKEIFNDDYAYFSSYSRTWLEHSRQYAEMMVQRFNLGAGSLVVELASNDGYLLQYFKSRGVPVLGIEPSLSVARVAVQKGIDTVVDFFGAGLAEKLGGQGRHADLIAANNVLAHVPDLNDFVRGMKALLKPNGVITIEFPHLMELIENNQFDTIYQEHYSYFSLHTVRGIFAEHGLTIFDVDILNTHGGSLRIYAAHAQDKTKKVSANILNLLGLEKDKGMLSIDYYKGFPAKAQKVRADIIDFLSREKISGKKIAAYGAAAKGNTLLNYCGIHRDVIDFVVDASKYKQGKFLPGSHIPIVAEDRIRQTRPDYILILPWNLKDEITAQLSYVRQWGGKFVIPVPSLEVF